MLVRARRSTYQDKRHLTDFGRPTQLGLGDASLGTGIEAIQAELKRMLAALATWLDHLTLSRSQAGPAAERSITREGWSGQ
jgi:hypothetical protein